MNEMMDWATRECEIAKKREGEDYGCACYDSALKAFKSLCEDEHSGYSIRVTKQILDRLIDGKPLTPIEDNSEDWNLMSDMPHGEKYESYQCNRMDSLFKHVYPDGSIEYSDIDRYVMKELDSKTYWHSGLIDMIGREMYPITMPYIPADKPYVFNCEELLTDRANGDFDTVAIWNACAPGGSPVKVKRFFREPHEGETLTKYGCWIEIDEEEFTHRKLLHNLRIVSEVKGEEDQ